MILICTLCCRVVVSHINNCTNIRHLCFVFFLLYYAFWDYLCIETLWFIIGYCQMCVLLKMHMTDLKPVWTFQHCYIYKLVEHGMLRTIINRHNHTFNMFHLVVSYKKRETFIEMFFHSVNCNIITYWLIAWLQKPINGINTTC